MLCTAPNRKSNEMVILKNILLVIFIANIFDFNNAQENICIINGKKSLNTVSKEFLSFSIDPAMILSPQSGFKNISTTTSLKLAQYMTPGFIRISGPSTEFLQFTEVEHNSSNHLTITPTTWKHFNVWIKKSKLTPIFAVNDKFSHGAREVWDPKTLSPLLKVNDEMEFSCYWQIGSDCEYKTLSQYKEDLQTFRNFLDSYPTRQSYKLVGSNLHSCLAHRSPELAGKFMESLEYIADALIWETDFAKSISFMTKTYMPIWLSLPKDSSPASFASGLQWAKQLGDAAKAGYKAVFRQPRIHELYSDTPVYWISIIYKALMGQNVLEVNTKNQYQHNSYTYAHCAKNQRPDEGAITIMIINNESDQYTSYLRLATSSQPKVVEIQMYILTSEEGNSRNIYLNDAKLTMDDLNSYPYKPAPRIRRVKVDKFLSLTVPAKSMGFFVLPAAKIKVCIDANHEQILSSKEMPIQFSEKINKPSNLQDLFQSINKEIEQDEKFYEVNDKPQAKSLFDRSRINKLKNNKVLKDRSLRNYINELRYSAAQSLTETTPTKRPSIFNNSKKRAKFQLNKPDIRRVLRERVKNKIRISSSESENSMTEATKPLYTRQKRNRAFHLKPIARARHIKSKPTPTKKHRARRDINMNKLRHADERYVQNRSRYLPNNRPSYNKDVDNFDSMQREEDYGSQDYGSSYEQNPKKHHRNNYEDERIRFLSEAYAVRNPRMAHHLSNQTIIKRDISYNNVLKERLIPKHNRHINKSNSKFIGKEIFEHPVDHSKNQVEKAKMYKLENKQRVKKIRNKENTERHKRMISNEEYVPNVPTLNAFQSYKVNNVVLKSWKPQDILNIKQAVPYSVEQIESIECLQVPASKHSNKKRNTNKEEVTENAIEFPFNDINKETESYNEINESNDYSTTTLPTQSELTTTPRKGTTNAPVLFSNNFIDIISDTKNNKLNGSSQQTKISINEESIVSAIMSATSSIIEGIAAKVASMFP